MTCPTVRIAGGRAARRFFSVNIWAVACFTESTQAVIHAWEGFVMPRALTVGEEEGVADLSMILRALRV